MKKIIFTIALFTVAITTHAATEARLTLAPQLESASDTIRSYSIDGVHINNFTGKELAGKTIKSYEILYDTVAADNSVIETHLIKTTTPPAKKEPEPHYLLDGKEVNLKELNSLPTEKIQSIEVLKAGSKAALQYSKDGDVRGYVLIKTKK